MKRLTIAVFLIGFLAAENRLRAQWENDGPGAALRINGAAASVIDPVGHDVGIPLPSTLTIDVLSGANAFMPVLLAASGVDPSGVAIANVAGLGILNIGAPALPLPTAIQILGDGIGRTVNPVTDALYVTGSGATPSFNLAYTLGTASCMVHAALQAVVVDPTKPPFMLDLTEAADLDLSVMVAPDLFSIVLVHGNAVSLSVPLGGDYRFDFHGQSYSMIHVAKAGYVTFGSPTTLGPAGLAIDSYSFAGAEPAIAAWQADWNPQRWGPTDGVLVRRTNNVLEVRWGDPSAMPSGAPGVAHTGDVDANRFGIRMVLTPVTQNPCLAFDPNFGSFDVSIDAILTTTTVQPGDGVIGHTPGGATAQFFGIDRDLHRPASTGFGTCMIEEHDASNLSPSILGWNALGTPRHYNDIRSFAQTTIAFVPQSGQIAGDGGYTSSADRPAPSDVQSLIPASWQRSGGETVTIIGKFTGFNDITGSGGLVEIIDAASTVVAATVVGIRDSTGQSQPMLPNSPNSSSLRDGEAMVLTTPSMNGLVAPLSLRVSFQNGYVESLPLSAWTGFATDTFSPGDEGNIRYNLRSQPIRFYGTTYTEIFISSNGICSFVRPERQSNPSTTTFLNSFGGGPKPSVAVLWTDLAPPTNGQGGQVMVTQDPSTGVTNIAWNGFQYFQAVSNCGPFSISFLPGDLIQMNLSAVVPSPFFLGLPSTLNGVSDGGPGPDFNINLAGSSMFFPAGSSLYRFFSIINANNFALTFNGMPNFHDTGADGTWSLF